MQDFNAYTSMLLLRARQQEMIEQAEKHRLASVQNEISKRVRQAKQTNDVVKS